MSPVSQQSLSLCPWLEKPLEAMSSAPGSQARCFLCSLGWLELQHRAANPTCFQGKYHMLMLLQRGAEKEMNGE